MKKESLRERGKEIKIERASDRKMTIPCFWAYSYIVVPGGVNPREKK